MENTILILLFLAGLVVFLTMLKVDVLKAGLTFILRGVLGIVMIQFINYWLVGGYESFMVSINEITVALSGILGIWGVVFCYAMRIYFTIWC